ncbi:hypothetical protein [Mycolicibacterium fortuitum]|uniref:hypothetical protein n=1 Tax=Mycolicibacterium fortuitum TaxID=1766 RepID=UPI001CE1A496|nr:hypothetical protein [Mycolicibacterium fortuitum]MCA4726898.1 hypothetical protein [Mycolicibacterium fortuitum]
MSPAASQTVEGRRPVFLTGEVFHCWNWQWNIDPARIIVAATAREPVPIEVAEFAELIGGPWIAERQRASCAPVDLTVPVLVAELPVPFDGRRRLLIDGWHRIELARSKRIATLPAYVLTAEESAQVSERDAECNGCGHCGHYPLDPDDRALTCSRWCSDCAQPRDDDDDLMKVRKLAGRYMGDPAFRAAHPACAYCDADLAIRQPNDGSQAVVLEYHHEAGCPSHPDTPLAGNRASRRAAARQRAGVGKR